MVKQIEIRLSPKERGFHLVDREIFSQIGELPQAGLVHLFLQHTSAGLTINENADPSVREDLESSLNDLVKENLPYYTHTYEGPDDMPAHIKSSLVGVELTIPVTNKKPNLGTWQGITLCEFRNHASARKIIATIFS